MRLAVPFGEPRSFVAIAPRWIEACGVHRETIVEEHLDVSPTLKEMAALVRLSTYYFAR